MCALNGASLGGNILSLCPECGTELDEHADVCMACGAARVDVESSANGYELAVDNLTDQLIAGAFAITSKRGQDEMSGIITDMSVVNWNTIAIETVLFFHHMIERYAEGLFGQEVKVQIMEKLELPLVGKFAKAGSVSDENMDNFHKMYVHNLEQRCAEYNKYQLGNVIDEEIALGADGTFLSDKERTEKFASIFISEDDISEASSGDDEGFKAQLLWQFGRRIAELLGEPDSAKVITYVYRYTIVFLFLTLNPVKELNSLRNLLGPNDAV